MNPKLKELLTINRHDKLRDIILAQLPAPRVMPVIDGTKGTAVALYINHRATNREIIAALGPETTAFMGMEFELDQTDQRFLIRDGGLPGVIDLVPWDSDISKNVDILVDTGSQVVLSVQPGINDHMFLLIGRRLFGDRVIGISQEGVLRSNGSTTIKISVDKNLPEILCIDTLDCDLALSPAIRYR
jgi:hypothetical protein